MAPRCDNDDHKQVVLPKELLHDVRAIAWALDVSEDEAIMNLLERGRSAFLEKVDSTDTYVMDGVGTLRLSRTIGRREHAWLYRHSAAGWIVAYRLVPKAGRPAVAEVRVFPDDGTTENGGDGGTWSGEESHVPDGGLPGRVIRSEVKVVDDLALVGDKLRRFREHFGEVTEAFDGIELASRLAPTGGKGKRNDRRLAEVAAAYEEALDRHSRAPAVEAAKRLGISNAKRVHEMMFEARDRGIFKGGSQGRAGGRMTDHGRALLEKKEG